MTLSQWAGMIRRVVLVYPSLFFFFMSFILITSYGILYGIIACIVQESIVAARIAEEIAANDALEERRFRSDQGLAILRQADRDNDGVCTPEEIDKAFARTDLLNILEEINAPAFNGANLIRLFDRDGSGNVSCVEIMDGMVHMDEDVKNKDYIRLAMWASNCLQRSIKLGDRVEALSGKVSELRSILEKAMAATEYYQTTKDSTELRFRAITTLRSSPPGAAPKLKGWKPPKPPKRPPEDEAHMFMGFVQRSVGLAGGGEEETGAVDEDGHDSHEAIAVGTRGELPPAPPRLAVAQAAVKEFEASICDKYAPTRDDPEKHNMPAPSPSLKTLRHLLDQ